jgi:hypothetical protein
VAGAVAREKRDAAASKRRHDVGAGRIAEWCRDDALFAIRELGHVVQTAAADDADAYV